MVIGIDGNEANIPNRVGVNMYAYEIIKNLHLLVKDAGSKDKLIVFLKNPPLKHMPKSDNFIKYKVLSGGPLWVATKLSPYLVKKSHGIDVFFSPSHYSPLFSRIPRVCAIMDLGYLEFSGQFRQRDYWQLKWWSAYSLVTCKKVLAISHSTSREIVRHYPITAKKVTVTHLGYDKSRFNVKVQESNVRRVKEKYSIVGDYILFLSTLKPSKNVEGLLAAWTDIVTKFPSLKLVIAGKKGWLYEPIFKIVKERGHEGSVIFTDFVPEADKPALIRGARAFVLPSFWEGFGHDPLQALACGVPVVVSNVASLPEVVGEAGVLVDPNKSEEIAKGIKKVLSLTKVQYNKLVLLGLKQAEKFSWEKTARATLAVLKEAQA